METQPDLFNDGVLRATVFDTNWLVIRWITNDRGYLSKTAVKDLRRVEARCQASFKGWIMLSEKENTGMHKIIERLGGTPRCEDNQYKVFIKEF